MTVEVTFLHAADLHLGSPLKSVGDKSQDLRRKLEEAGYTALERLTDAAIRQNVDFVVFSGDIYDQEVRSVTANQLFIHHMKRFERAGIPVYLIYGNHDPLDAGSEYFSFPENVRVFPSDSVHLEEVMGREGKVIARVLGQSYRNRSENRKMYDGYNPPDRDVVNIGLLHTGLNPSTNKYVPCSMADLKTKEAIHYWALGHVHRRSIMSRKPPAAAFPGFIQGRDPGETGCGGCLLVQLRPGTEPSIKLVPTSPVIWINRQVEIRQDDESIDDIRERLLEEARHILDSNPAESLEVDLADGEAIQVDGFIVRWELTGKGRVHRDVISKDEEGTRDYLTDELRGELGSAYPFVWTESVHFSTAPPLPQLETIPEEDEVLQHLDRVYRAIKNGEAREDILQAMGDIWYEQKDHEETRDYQFPVTDDAYARVVEKAYRLAVERIVEGRDQA